MKSAVYCSFVSQLSMDSVSFSFAGFGGKRFGAGRSMDVFNLSTISIGPIDRC